MLYELIPHAPISSIDISKPTLGPDVDVMNGFFNHNFYNQLNIQMQHVSIHVHTPAQPTQNVATSLQTSGVIYF